MSLEYIPLEKLAVSRCNVRQRVDEEAVRKLMLNIVRHGLLNPLTVRPEDGKFGIVCGRLRYEAIKRIKKEYPEVFKKLFGKGVPCIVRELDDKEAALLSLSENLRQNTMTKEEIGAALERLQEEFGLSREDLSRELQLLVDEIQQALKVWRSVKTVGVRPAAKPGRPPKTVERPKRVSTTAVGVLSTLARRLEREGIVKDSEKLARKLTELSAGMSTKEVQLLASRIRSDPRVVLSEKKLKKLVEEIKSSEKVERIVLLRADLAEKISRIARTQNKTFDEVLNEVVEEGLKHIKMPYVAL